MFGVAIAIATVILATLAGWALWRSPRLLCSGRRMLHADQTIDKHIQYQAAFLLVALCAVAVVEYASSAAISPVFGPGNINAAVSLPGALLMAEASGLTWGVLGCLLVLGFGLATCLLVLPVLRAIPAFSLFFQRFGAWAIVFAAVNAWSEELIYRGVILACAMDYLASSHIAMLSATLFALAHIRGQANGLVVVLGSAFAGWVLAYAAMQTQGLFWAWCIHFVQDVFIFLAFFAAGANSPSQRASPSPSEASQV